MERDPLSPDDRALFDELKRDIEEELRAQVAVGRLDDTAARCDGVGVTAALLADVVWRGFDIRRR